MKPKVKETYVTRKNPAEIFSVIENFLSDNIDTQIFVDNEIYKELKYHGHDFNVYQANYENSSHYHSHYHGGCKFSITDSFKLTSGCFFDKEIAHASFVQQTKEYNQLIDFASSKIKDYAHFHVGFKQLLFIHFEAESK